MNQKKIYLILLICYSYNILFGQNSKYLSNIVPIGQFNQTLFGYRFKNDCSTVKDLMSKKKINFSIGSYDKKNIIDPRLILNSEPSSLLSLTYQVMKNNNCQEDFSRQNIEIISKPTLEVSEVIYCDKVKFRLDKSNLFFEEEKGTCLVRSINFIDPRDKIDSTIVRDILFISKLKIDFINERGYNDSTTRQIFVDKFYSSVYNFIINYDNNIYSSTILYLISQNSGYYRRFSNKKLFFSTYIDFLNRNNEKFPPSELENALSFLRDRIVQIDNKDNLEFYRIQILKLKDSLPNRSNELIKKLDKILL